MNTPPDTTSPEQGKNVTERYGAWILSACFHVILFAGLLMARPAIFRHARGLSEPIRVTLSEDAATAAAPPGPELAAAAPGSVAAVDALPDAATSIAGNRAAPPQAPLGPAVTVLQATKLDRLPAAQPAPNTPPERQVASNSLLSALKPLDVEALKAAQSSTLKKNPTDPKGEGSGPGGDPRAGGSTEPGPASPDGTYAQGASRKRGEGIGGEGTGAGQGGSAAIGGRISIARATLQAHKTFDTPENLFGGRGASAAAVRELDIGGVPGDRAKLVLDRYGIKVMAAGSLLGGGAIPYKAMSAGQGQFVTRFNSGNVGIFRFSSVAAGRMMELEEKYLRDQGLAPEQTRIVSVVFGVVAARDGYDLGVVQMRTEPLAAPAGRKPPSSTPPQGKTP